MNKIIERCAWEMFKKRYTEQGFDDQWCVDAFAVERYRKEYIILAEICIETYVSSFI
jgi:hypothetical protein